MSLLDRVQYMYNKPEVTLPENIPRISVANADGELQIEFLYDDLFLVRIFLRQVNTNREILHQDRLYTCHVARLPGAAAKACISDNFDVVFTAIEVIVECMKHDIDKLSRLGKGEGKNLRSRKRYDGAQMTIRIVPNFMPVWHNLVSPTLPLHIPMHQEGGHMESWFKYIGGVIQSAQSRDRTLEPILQFMGTEEETVDIFINLLGDKRLQNLVDDNKHLRHKRYFNNSTKLL